MYSSRWGSKVANKSRTGNNSLKVILPLLRLLSMFHVTSRRQVIGTERYSPTLKYYLMVLVHSFNLQMPF